MKLRWIENNDGGNTLQYLEECDYIPADGEDYKPTKYEWTDVPVVKAKVPEGLLHEDSGRRCLVAHLDEKGRLQESCIQCKHCRLWVRRKNMSCPCSARIIIQDEPTDNSAKNTT